MAEQELDNFTPRPTTPAGLMRWLANQMPWYGDKQREELTRLSTGVKYNRLICWRFDLENVSVQTMENAIKVVNAYAHALKGGCTVDPLYETPGQKWFISLATQKCTFDPKRYVDVSDVLHQAISNANGDYKCEHCFDVGQLIAMCEDYCCDPGCTDIVNAQLHDCQCSPTQESDVEDQSE